ncbi:hypothetical protein MMC09_006014, partial [Bachmanniomyces sp. S44760]|nr:hypothetical protein [Bachmanniomyces sp. S44760]
MAPGTRRTERCAHRCCVRRGRLASGARDHRNPGERVTWGSDIWFLSYSQQSQGSHRALVRAVACKQLQCGSANHKGNVAAATLYPALCRCGSPTAEQLLRRVSPGRLATKPPQPRPVAIGWDHRAGRHAAAAGVRGAAADHRQPDAVGRRRWHRR